MDRVVTASEALKAYRTKSEQYFKKFHWWEDLRTLEKRIRAEILYVFPDIKWGACVIAGSRSRGLEHKNSNLDVFFFYRGGYEEEDILLKPTHDKVEITLHPVRVFGRGERIVDVLAQEEEYLALKATAAGVESALHNFYVAKLDNLLKRPRYQLVNEILGEIKSGNANKFLDELERIGYDVEDFGDLAEYARVSERAVQFLA